MILISAPMESQAWWHTSVIQALRKYKKALFLDLLDSQSRLLAESWVNEEHYQRNMVAASWGPTSKFDLVSTHMCTHMQVYTHARCIECHFKVKQMPNKNGKGWWKTVSMET